MSRNPLVDYFWLDMMKQCISEIAVTGLAFMIAFSFAAPALAHTNDGLAQPKIQVTSSSPEKFVFDYKARVTDTDSGKPLAGAKVTLSATATGPTRMIVNPKEMKGGSQPGLYRARFRFPIAADWRVVISVSGTGIAESSVAFKESIKDKDEGSHRSGRSFKSAGSGAVRWNEVAAQAAHIIFAVFWVGGNAFVVMVLRPLLMTDPKQRVRQVFADIISLFSRLAGLFIVFIIATGVYNAVYNVPVPLTEIAEEPFGDLYLGLLVAKLALFLVAIILGAYSAVAIAPKLRADTDFEYKDSMARRMVIVATVNFLLGVAILASAAALGRLHHFLH